MPYANSHFQPIAELPSEYGLTLWGYATRNDPCAVRAPGYFQVFSHHLKLGDLLLVRHTGERIGPDVAERPAPVLALYGIDKDVRGTIVLHEIWRFAWADARAAAARAAAEPAAQPAADGAVSPAGTPAPTAPATGAAPAADAPAPVPHDGLAPPDAERPRPSRATRRV